MTYILQVTRQLEPVGGRVKTPSASDEDAEGEIDGDGEIEKVSSLCALTHFLIL